MSRLRVAVIGGGHLGKIHARLISSIDDVHLVALAETNPMARKAVYESLNQDVESLNQDVEIVSDYRTLIGQIDAAVIATPTRTHFEIASNLLPAGIHALIEKPLTDSACDAQAIVSLADRHDCVVAVGHCEQFNSAIRCAVEEVGSPKFIQTSRMSGYTFRSTDIGVVHDLMIHDIDLVNSMFPGQLIDTRASGISVFGDHEDIAQSRLQFSCGGVANLTASRCSFSSERSIQIFGTEGFARVDLATQQVDVVRVPSWIRQREFDFESITAAQKDFVREQLFDKVLTQKQTEVEPVNAILCEQQDWIEAICNGSSPRVSAEQGGQAVEIAQSVLDAIANHCWSQNGPTMTGPVATPPISAISDLVPAELRPSLRRAA